LPSYVKGRKYIAELNAMIYGIISKRKSEENPPHDLLQLLIEAKYEDGSCMTDEQIRDEVMTVFWPATKPPLMHYRGHGIS
jgi:cytochrome P450